MRWYRALCTGLQTFIFQLKKTSASRPLIKAVRPVIASNGFPYLQMIAQNIRNGKGSKGRRDAICTLNHAAFALSELLWWLLWLSSDCLSIYKIIILTYHSHWTAMIALLWEFIYLVEFSRTYWPLDAECQMTCPSPQKPSMYEIKYYKNMNTWDWTVLNESQNFQTLNSKPKLPTWELVSRIFMSIDFSRGKIHDSWISSKLSRDLWDQHKIGIFYVYFFDYDYNFLIYILLFYFIV